MNDQCKYLKKIDLNIMGMFDLVQSSKHSSNEFLGQCRKTQHSVNPKINCNCNGSRKAYTINPEFIRRRKYSGIV